LNALEIAADEFSNTIVLFRALGPQLNSLSVSLGTKAVSADHHLNFLHLLRLLPNLTHLELDGPIASPEQPLPLDEAWRSNLATLKIESSPLEPGVLAHVIRKSPNLKVKNLHALS